VLNWMPLPPAMSTSHAARRCDCYTALLLYESQMRVTTEAVPLVLAGFKVSGYLIACTTV
jgi:hypothetical protein